MSIDRLLAYLIEQVVDDLMTSGNGDKATRLVLSLEDGRDGGGWARRALQDRIRKTLTQAIIDALGPTVCPTDLAALADKQATVLKLVATGIWRRPENNACGLEAAAAAVHAVEWVQQLQAAYVEGDKDRFDVLMENPKI